MVGVKGYYKLALWLDKMYDAEAFVQSERQDRPTTMLWLADTIPCLLIVHPYVQGMHWSNTSCTLHPWVCYHRGRDGFVKTFSCLFISDHLTHDTVAVYAFQKKLVEILNETLGKEVITLEAMEYNFDGCSKQYKNKKFFLNLTFHQLDFGVPANVSFSATSHGKGPWDGVAGLAKNEAALESLRRPTDNKILTAKDFLTFMKKKI